jgi:hypothetical protein
MPLLRLSCILLVLAAIFLAAPAAAHGPPPGTEPPPEAFCVVVIQPEDGFRQVRITVDENLTARAKAEAWQAANLNGDGLVSPQEGEAFRYATLQFWPGGLGMGNRSVYLEPGAPYTTATPMRPVYAASWRHIGHGFYEDDRSPHTGLSSTDSVPLAALETQAVREYGFHVGDDFSRMSVHGGDENATAGLGVDSQGHVSRPVIEYVVVRAPPGWVVATVTGHTYNGTFTRHGEGDTLQVAGFDTSLPWRIDFFSPEADKRLSDLGSPGFEVWGLPLALIVAGLARLRRRR